MSDHLVGEATALVVCFHVGADLPADAVIEGIVRNHVTGRFHVYIDGAPYYLLDGSVVRHEKLEDGSTKVTAWRDGKRLGSRILKSTPDPGPESAPWN
jgi:hypothetical protein